MAHKSLINLPAAAFDGDDVPIIGGGTECGKARIQGAWVLTFDDGAHEAALSQPFQMPANYAGGTLMADVWTHFASETTATDEAVLEMSLEAITTGDAVDLGAGRSFDSVNRFEVDPPGTAGYVTKTTVALPNADDVLAGDMVQLHIQRNHDDAEDTAVDDIYVRTVELWEST